MTYKRIISFRETPNIFLAITRAVEHLSKKYQTHNRKELESLLKTDYQVEIVKQIRSRSGDYYRYTIDFESKHNFSWFLLRWA